MNDMTIGFSPEEQKRFEMQLSKFTKEKIAALKKVVTKSGYNVRAGAIAKVPKMFGVLRNSISLKYGAEGLAVRVDSNADYAPYVEFGTKSKVEVPPELAEYASQFRGGKGGSFDDLLESIKLWALRKGLPESAAYPIAVKIAKEGVKAQPFLYPAFKEEQARFLERIRQAMQ